MNFTFDVPVPELCGIHQLMIPVSDLSQALDFYEETFGARRSGERDRAASDGAVCAYCLWMPGLGCLLELRLAPELAAVHDGFSAVTFAVDDRTTLERWLARFEALGVRNSGLITSARSWFAVAEDPDGHRIRLHALRGHGGRLRADADDDGGGWWC